jgi:hypothetical protein
VVEPEDQFSIVREWEEYKHVRGLTTDTQFELIPEEYLKRSIARRGASVPDAVTDLQIRAAAVELCRHYGQFRMIPCGWDPTRQIAPIPQSSHEHAEFWREREQEFRKHDTHENTHLAAQWFLVGDGWRLYAADRSGSLNRSEQVFRALAREAAKGLMHARRSDTSLDWLDLLGCIADPSSGRLLFSKVTSISSVTGERKLTSELENGDEIPSGGGSWNLSCWRIRSN